MVRYFVREEAGEFVYLALQLCQLSLHNAMAQIHSAMVSETRDGFAREVESQESSGSPPFFFLSARRRNKDLSLTCVDANMLLAVLRPLLVNARPLGSSRSCDAGG